MALSDGGSGLEDFFQNNFGRVEAVILDFWHVAEYLGDLSKALYPGQEEEAQTWRGQWCHRLKHEGGAVVLAGLAALDVRGRAAVVREALHPAAASRMNRPAAAIRFVNGALLR